MERCIGVRRGAWTEEEDILLRHCVDNYGEGKWCQIPHRAGLNRCRKSCRMRWLNYLKPTIKRGGFAEDEVDLMVRLHKLLGNRWSLIAGRLPGRTANDVKNFWNTNIHKKEISPIKDMKEKAQDIVKMNIIKPRPWTLTKKWTRLSGKPTTTESFEPKENVSNISPGLMPSLESRIKWRGSLLDDKEGDERATCTASGLDKESNRDLWVENIAEQEEKVGNTFDSYDSSFLADISFDTSLWDFLNKE